MTDSRTTHPTLPGGFAAISKYNPHLWTPDQLRAIFVARQRELADLTQTLASLKPGEVGQHCLLVGTRGMGKSTLMQRLALAVEDDPGLRAAWLPLRFPEEQYTVNTLAQFWANVLDSLADALERQGEATEAIDATAARLANLPPSEQAEATLQAIRDISRERGQRLLLLVDNTDLLLHNIGPKGQWALRQVLQSESQLLWVGGSYQSLEANSQYHDAFLDFFRVIELRPLNLDEMQEALLALAQTFGGESARSSLLDQLKKQPERLPTLRLLSGGNPRTTVMLYELLASGQAGHVRSDLEALLDSMTPLYKARLDALADLPRKLLAHILGHWAPMSLAQLAEASQEKKTSISPQLQRLELEGLIQKTKLHGTTRSGYQAAERFFNIWYLMRLSPRRQRTRLGWLVEFMRLWFNGDELCDLARTRMTSNHADHPHEWDYDSALADALPDGTPEKHGLRWTLLKQLQTQREALSQVFDFEGIDQDFKGAEDYLHRARELPELLRHCPHAKSESEKQRWVASVMGSIVTLNLRDKTQIAKESAGLDQRQYKALLETLEKEPAALASAWGTDALDTIHSLVLKLDFFPDMPDSALAFQQIRFGCEGHNEAVRAAALLHFQQHEDEFSLKSLELAQAAFPNDAKLVHRRAWLMHHKLGRYIEAEKVYRQAIALDGKQATIWNDLGNLLAVRLRRIEDAVDAHQHAITLDEKFAPAWHNLGNTLGFRLGRHEEAERAYRQAIAIDEKNATTWAHLGNLLGDYLERFDEAEIAFRKAISINEKDASNWTNLGMLLHDHLGRSKEAEQAFEQAIALDKNDFYTAANFARLLWEEDRRTEAIAEFERCVHLVSVATPGEDELTLRAPPNEILMQAHLVLNNQQLAQKALDKLAEKAQQKSEVEGFLLRQQIWETTRLGLGERLADWMQDSPHAPFLQPMIQALYILAGAESKLQDLPAEIQQMADAVVLEARKRLRRGDAANNKPAPQ